MLLGYRLHLERLKFSGKKSIRTIKFPLGAYEDKGKRKRGVVMGKVEQAFAENIKQDYESLYGPLNLSTYKYNKDIYSLKDFWVDCLRTGAIMKHTESKLLNDLRIIVGEQQSIDEREKKLMRKKDKNFFESIDFEKFKSEVLLSGGFRKSKKNLDIFKDKESKKNKTLSEDILKRTVGKNHEEQEKYWHEKYGVDKGLYTTKNPKLQTTFFLLPIFEFDKKRKKSVIDLVDRVDRQLQLKECLGDDYIKVEEYIGMSDDYGGLAQALNRIFEYLVGNDTKAIKEVFLNMAPDIWKGKEKELDDRLKFLSNQAKKVGHPKLVKDWDSYRSDLGGSISSWISNSFRQDGEIKKQLFGWIEEKRQKDGSVKDTPHKGHKDELSVVLEDIETGEFTSSAKEDETVKEKAETIRETVQQMQSALEKMPKWNDEQKIEVAQLEDYRDLLAPLRSDLNFIYQQVYKLDTEDEEVKLSTKQKKELAEKRADKRYPVLFKELPRIPSFIGDVKIQQSGVYDKYLSSVERMFAGIDFLLAVQNKEGDIFKTSITIDNPEERVRKVLQQFLRIYQTTQSKCTKDIVKSVMGKLSERDIDSICDYDHFYRAPQARERRGEEIGISCSAEQCKDAVPALLKKAKIRWDKYRDVKYLNDWIGFIEIEKIRIGLMASFYDISSLYSIVKGLPEKHFPKVGVVFNRFSDENKKQRGENIQTVIQTGVFSELRGTAVKMTTRQFIARYVVQPMKSEEGYPVATDVEAYGKNRVSGQRYYIFNGIAKAVKKNDIGGKNIIAEKNVKSGVLKKKNLEDGNLMEIHSSKYQTQFLDNALSGHWSESAPKISSYSFIYEELWNIKWSNDRMEMSEDKGKRRLFVSIPFEVGKGPTQIGKINKQRKFLGIDIGEYGVATYLLDTENFKHPDEMLFIFEPSMRRIRHGIQENVKHQRAGTFSIPNTKVKRLRDNTIHSLRNKIHALIVKHGAWSVYEKEVSAFESGSGKISKVYHSIKRADVYKGGAAEELDGNLVWGDKKLVVGRDVGAYATSYICSHCHKSIYGYIARDDYDREYEVTHIVKSKEDKKFKQVVELLIDGEQVKGYVERDKGLKIGDTLNGKETLNAIKKYARPPLDVAMERNKQVKKVVDNIGGRERFEQEAGSQAVYICPFCDEISDADIQAAMWIALKGYLNLFIYDGGNKEIPKHFSDADIALKWGGVEKGKRGAWSVMEEISMKEKVRFLSNFAKKNKIPHVSFNLKQRLSDKNK